MIRSDYKPVLVREDMRRLDEATIAAGTTGLALMETAGERVADFVVGHLDSIVPRGRRLGGRPGVIVLAGPGNNGGDGYVVARMLAAQGWAVTVAVCGKEPTATSDAGVNATRWREGGGATIDLVTCESRLGQESWDLALDCLFGTGLDRALEPPYTDLITALNGSGLPTVSVDIPSGLCADTGHPLGMAVLADATVTLGAAKPGLFVGVGPSHAGKIALVDIGLLDPAAAGLTAVGQVIDDETCALWVPHRHAMTHKGELGHILVVGGARGKTGATLLAARAALRSGAGLVTMAVPSSVAVATDAALVEAMTLVLPESRDGGPSDAAWNALARRIREFDVAVVGPGLGTGKGARTLVERMLGEFSGLLVVDADGLNVLAAERAALAAKLKSRRERGHGGVILTPHPGEMGRLTDLSSAEVQQDRLGICRSFTRSHRATLVLKGAGTIVCDGERTGFNASGNAGMAAPGVGDVLAGATAALAARVGSAFEAASLAVFLHGMAGDLLAENLGGAGLLASELADELPRAFAALGA